MVVPKEKFGIIAKPSTRITITFAAINCSPKEFVSDCTTIIAIDRIICVSPDGMPRRIRLKQYFFFGRR